MKTILIIEDQPDMAENLATILSMERFAVITAGDGATGFAMARDEKPDLILCDIMMPEMNGQEVLAALRNEPSVAGTPFIFLTSLGEKKDLRTGMNLGADDYLVKPIGAGELLAAVAARLDREDKRRSGYAPDFSSAEPLAALGLTPREAEVLLWVAQGKSNPEIGTILGAAGNTIRVHLAHIFEKIGVDNRHSAALAAWEKLASR